MLLVSSSQLVCPATAIPPDPIVRVNQTLQGMLQYYWTHDPINKNISFFFACGQMGGWGSTTWDHCACKNPSSCSDCYRWWDAVALESIANYAMLIGREGEGEGFADMPDQIYAHSPYNAFWPSKYSTYVDDFGWYGIAYLKVYGWLKVCPLIIYCYILQVKVAIDSCFCYFDSYIAGHCLVKQINCFV